MLAELPGRVCSAIGCARSEGLELVRDHAGRERMLCPRHAKDFLGVSS